jgi:undecaprenyl-diphosphatase
VSETKTNVRIARLWPVISGVGAIALVALIALMLVYRQNLEPFNFELAWMEDLIERRSDFWTGVALFFDTVGGGLLAIVVIPTVIILGFIMWRRPWAALYFAIAAVVGGGVVQLIKNLVGRPRPPDILVQPDFGSFPSGHSANAAVVATVLGIIFWRIWVWVVGAFFTLAMMVSRTYLGAHWISDTIGGLLIGAAVAVILWAPFAYLLYREREGAHPPWRKRKGPTDGSALEPTGSSDAGIP